MQRKLLNRKSFGTLGVLVIVLLVAVGSTGAYVYHQNHRKAVLTTADNKGGKTQPASSTTQPAPTDWGVDTKWSGYESGPTVPGPYNYVQGEFNVPSSFTCTKPNAGAAIWVGIDGVDDAPWAETVEQGGLQITCSDATQPTISYKTFAVLFGTSAPYDNTPLQAKPGDQLFVSVRYVNSQYYFTVKNLTSDAQPYTAHYPCNVSYLGKTYACQRSSVEWIVENNGYNIFGKFSPIMFSDAYASADNGKLTPISVFHPVRVVLTNGDSQQYLDSVSSLNNSGDAFAVSWLRSQ